MPSRAEGRIDVFRDIFSSGKEASLQQSILVIMMPFSVFVAQGGYELYEFVSFPKAHGPVFSIVPL